MPRKKPGSKPDGGLRVRAEKFLAQTGPDPATPLPTDIRKLVHDLHLHQIELDMQNEELRRSQGETAAACAKYADLYDFAPIGYFTFDPQGIILEANLTGARLLGAEPGSLLHTPFVSHVAPAFRPEFTAHLCQVFATQARQFCTLELATPGGRRPACSPGEHRGPDGGRRFHPMPFCRQRHHGPPTRRGGLAPQ